MYNNVPMFIHTETDSTNSASWTDASVKHSFQLTLL